MRPKTPNRALLALFGLSGLAACAMSTDVMDTGGGTYMVSAHGAIIRGGGKQIAYDDAKDFCAKRGAGLHPIVLTDAQPSSVNGQVQSTNVKLYDDPRNAELRFRCGR